MQVMIEVGLLALFGGGFLRIYAGGDLMIRYGFILAEIDLSIDSDGGSSDFSAHMFGVFITPRHIIKGFQFQPVQIPAFRLYVHMVYIPLGTVEENTVHRQHRFHGFADKAGIVRRDLGTADGIGMDTEVDQDKFFSVFSAYPGDAGVFIQNPDGS